LVIRIKFEYQAEILRVAINRRIKREDKIPA